MRLFFFLSKKRHCFRLTVPSSPRSASASRKQLLVFRVLGHQDQPSPEHISSPVNRRKLTFITSDADSVLHYSATHSDWPRGSSSNSGTWSLLLSKCSHVLFVHHIAQGLTAKSAANNTLFKYFKTCLLLFSRLWLIVPKKMLQSVSFILFKIFVVCFLTLSLDLSSGCTKLTKNQLIPEGWVCLLFAWHVISTVLLQLSRPKCCLEEKDYMRQYCCKIMKWNYNKKVSDAH